MQLRSRFMYGVVHVQWMHVQAHHMHTEVPVLTRLVESRLQHHWLILPAADECMALSRCMLHLPYACGCHATIVRVLKLSRVVRQVQA